MFTGIDEVDRASMRHAYGSAPDMPALPRGLASADPGGREAALDGMYGAAHHQADVYDSTPAFAPFLFALVQSAAVRERGGIVATRQHRAGGEDRERATDAYAMASTAGPCGRRGL